MRKYFNINEKSVCAKCTKKTSCNFFEKVPKENELKISLYDLNLILHGFYLNSLNTNDEKQNNSNSKILKLGSELNEEHNSITKNNSIKLKTINLKHNTYKDKEISTKSNIFEETSESINSKKFYFIDLENDKIIQRIPTEAWKSTSIITQVLKDTLEDIINDNGIVYKTMINAYIENKEKEKYMELIKDQNIKESNRRDEIINDPIYKLISSLETCRNRNERKRILAQFNKTVGFGWGEYKKIPKFEENDFDKNYEDDLNNDDYRTENKGKDNKKEIIRQIAEENKSKNTNNYNTIVYSEKKIKKIYSDSQKFNLIGSKFQQQINVKNQKIKALVNQKKLSLMLNDQSEDRTNVFIPGKDYGKAVRYIEEINENSKEKIADFEKLIDQKKKEYSVNLNNYIANKKGKTDKLIDLNKKITLLQLEKLGERTLLDQSNLKNENALLDFEMKIGKNNLLENKNPKNYKDNQITLADQKDNFESELSIYNQSNNYLSLNKNTEKDLNLNMIQFKQLNNNQQQQSNVSLFKQENALRKNEIKEKQEKSKINKVLKNKHIYQSMNYYKNNDLEHLAYERDPDVMNVLKYRNNIRKDKYYYQKDEQLNNKNNSHSEDN